MAKKRRLELLEQILDTRKSVADLKELGAAFLSEFGGVEGLAREMKASFDGTELASERNKILLAGVDLVKQVAGMNKGAEDPLASLSDEEIKSAVREMFVEDDIDDDGV